MTLSVVPGVRVGHAEVPGKKSGCTVILGPFRGAVEVRGMATGTRELSVLSPHHLVSRVNAVLLTGGSAFEQPPSTTAPTAATVASRMGSRFILVLRFRSETTFSRRTRV